jgi:hypothetical protein
VHRLGQVWSPGSRLQGAHGSVCWLPLGVAPDCVAWVGRAWLVGPRGPSADHHFGPQPASVRANWQEAPPGLDHLSERPVVPAARASVLPPLSWATATGASPLEQAGSTPLSSAASVAGLANASMPDWGSCQSRAPCPWDACGW